MDKVRIESAEYLRYLIVATKNGDLGWQAQNLFGKSNDDYVAKLDIENDTDICLTRKTVIPLSRSVVRAKENVVL